MGENQTPTTKLAAGVSQGGNLILERGESGSLSLQLLVVAARKFVPQEKKD